MNKASSPHRTSLAIAGILVLAAFLRLWGVGFGLPDLFHADEPVVVNHALAFGTGDLNPHFFNIPPLVSYLLFICYGCYFLIGSLAGLFHSLRDFEYLFYFDPSSFYLIARLIFGVLFGAASVYAFYRLARRLGDSSLGLWASFFLAVNFLHARDSHYVYADIPLLFALICAFYPILRISDEPSFKKWHVLAGFWIGLATATKYNGVFLVIPYIWICVRSISWKKWPALWSFAFLTAILTFIALNPFSVLDHGFFLKEIFEQSASNRGGLPWHHHFTYSLAGGMGWPMLVLALWGTLIALFRGDRKIQAIAIFALAYYAVLFFFAQPYDRYVLPLIPFALLLAAKVLLQWKARSSLIFWVLIPFLVLPSLIKIIHWDRIMSRPDVRTLAKEWVEANIPAGSRLALDGTFYMPRLAFSPTQLEEKKAKAGGGHHGEVKSRRIDALLSRPRHPSYELYFLNRDLGAKDAFLFSEPRIPFDVSALKENNIEYVFLIDGLHQDDDPFYQTLQDQAELVMIFSPYLDQTDMIIRDSQAMTGGPFLWSDILPRKRNGYPISVYRLRS